MEDGQAGGVQGGQARRDEGIHWNGQAISLMKVINHASCCKVRTNDKNFKTSIQSLICTQVTLDLDMYWTLL